jgi:hypothetical protein
VTSYRRLDRVFIQLGVRKSKVTQEAFLKNKPYSMGGGKNCSLPTPDGMAELVNSFQLLPPELDFHTSLNEMSSIFPPIISILPSGSFKVL